MSALRIWAGWLPPGGGHKGDEAAGALDQGASIDLWTLPMMRSPSQ